MPKVAENERMKPTLVTEKGSKMHIITAEKAKILGAS